MTGLVSAYKLTRGWPKKFPWPWNSVMKRIYTFEDSWVAFCELKVTGRFSCDDSTLQFLFKEAEEQSLNLSCSNLPMANALRLNAPVCCSMPSTSSSIAVAIPVNVSSCLLYMWHNDITVVSLHQHYNTCSAILSTLYYPISVVTDPCHIRYPCRCQFFRYPT